MKQNFLICFRFPFSTGSTSAHTQIVMEQPISIGTKNLELEYSGRNIFDEVRNSPVRNLYFQF